MKKNVLLLLVGVLFAGNLFANGQTENVSVEDWPEGPVTVICPWAVGGVADMVNRKAATYGSEYLGVPLLATNELGAGGNVALTNYLKNEANSNTLIFAGEGAFSIAPNVDGSDALRFTYDDYVPVINLYSAIFVMTSDVNLNITDLESLKAYGKDKKVKVAVNGVSGSEAFMTKALFKELGLELDLISYNGANLALDAAAKGETAFAVSHQSQAKGSVEGGILNPVVVFDKTGINNSVYKNVKGVGEYGYDAYFRNRCFVMARKGTDPVVINKIREAYLSIMKEPGMIDLYKSLMITADPMELAEFDKHVADVITIVKNNK